MRVSVVRTRGILVMLMAFVIPLGIAHAVSISMTGNLADWTVNNSLSNGVYSGANPTTTNPLAFNPSSGDVAYWVEDSAVASNSGYVEPGYGGQNFDLEAMYATHVTGEGLYLAIVTGFDQGGVWSWSNSSPQYLPGDVFLNFGAGYELAIQTSTGRVYSGTGTTWYTEGNPYNGGSAQVPALINVSGGATYTGIDLSTTLAPSSNASYHWAQIINDANVSPTNTGTATIPGIGTFTDAQSHNNTNDPNAIRPYASTTGWSQYDHNVIEVYLSDSILQSLGFTSAYGISATMFWTESCGNDQGTLANISVPGVPEPVTMVMLGCMGAGMLGARRIKRWKSAK